MHFFKNSHSSQLLHSATSTRATIDSFSLSGHGGGRSFDPTGQATFSPGHRDGYLVGQTRLSGQSGGPVGHTSAWLLCAWPPRNFPVFAPLNAIMERCNDLLELVQTVHEFRSVEYCSEIISLRLNENTCVRSVPICFGFNFHFSVMLLLLISESLMPLEVTRL